ncbi:gamma-glutamyltransferase [Bauldia sp.]|uniref:gamma-glutamyltransferase n=1 Tax=Bauldia sp. TaxID=2575872 RepID=UPI003BAACC19
MTTRHAVSAAIAAAALVSFVSVSQAIAPPAVRGDHGMVVSGQHLAAEVGNRILENGGNAIDAAVAASYALAVVYPCCGNIGGGGFATIRLADGREIFIDFREKAPQAATANMYIGSDGKVVSEESIEGYTAVAVPGTVLGLDTLLTKYGTMSRQEVMAPAINLARYGFALRQSDVDYLTIRTDKILKQPNAAAIFLNDGAPWPVGHRLVQTDLAATLEAIAENGSDAFYKGPIAEAIVAASSANDGILTMADFESYTVEERTPVACTYRGYRIAAAAPPSSGGTTLCLILNIVEGYSLDDLGYHSAAGIHVIVEALRHAFVDRNFLLGDPDFVHNPVEQLTSKAYAASIRAKIEPGKAGQSKGMTPGIAPSKGTETTHLSVMDRDGNAVALTSSVNYFFGAGVIAGDTGFFLNNTMNDFTIAPGEPTAGGLIQGANNVIAPGKRPLSSMTPTIVTKDGDVAMVLGSPGGVRIISIVAQTIMNVIDHGMTISAAVAGPRIHHQWMPDEVYMEPFALSADTKAALEAMGYTIVQQRPWGAAQAISIAEGGEGHEIQAQFVQDTMVFSRARKGTRLGHSDNRRPTGAAVGH